MKIPRHRRLLDSQKGRKGDLRQSSAPGEQFQHSSPMRFDHEPIGMRIDIRGQEKEELPFIRGRMSPDAMVADVAGSKSLSAVENARLRDALRELVARSSQTAVAPLLGVKQSTISSVLAGRQGSSFKVARRVAKLLGRNVDTILEPGTPPESAPQSGSYEESMQAFLRAIPIPLVGAPELEQTIRDNADRWPPYVIAAARRISQERHFAAGEWKRLMDRWGRTMADDLAKVITVTSK